jgi:hypothetical protein
MRRTDWRPVVSPPLPPVPGPTDLGSRPQEAGQSPAAHPLGGLAEEDASDWEAAWIDLGGEG